MQRILKEIQFKRIYNTMECDVFLQHYTYVHLELRCIFRVLGRCKLHTELCRPASCRVAINTSTAAVTLVPVPRRGAVSMCCVFSRLSRRSLSDMN
jgi:hypothetical protein